MTNSVNFSWQALVACARWEHHRFAEGPVACLLMHVVADAPGQLRADEDGTARACARLVLRNGRMYAVIASSARARLLDALLAVGGALAGERNDDACFSRRNAAIAAALAAAGLARASVMLEQGASVLPRPVLGASQLGRLALGALNTERAARGQVPLAELPAVLAVHFTKACDGDDPAVHTWRADLPPQALACLAAIPVPHGAGLDRLAVYNFLAARGGNCRNRVQAVEVLPWLLPLLTARGQGQVLSEVASIQEAIDEGGPLFKAVARAFDVPTEAVRWLGSRPLPPAWTLDAGRLHRLLALLSWLPPERRPGSACEFEALIGIGNALVAPLDFHATDEQPVLLVRYAACMGAWLRDLTRAGLAAASHDVSQLADDLVDARDFLRALFESVRASNAMDHEASVDYVLNFCSRTPIRRLLALSHHWHAQIGAEDIEADGSLHGWRWPAVLEQPWRNEERVIVELTSSAQLQAEGKAMRHCIGSYDAACSHGHRMIVSLRSTMGTSLSSAELLLSADVPHVSLGQHRGPGNGVPGPECVHALAALMHRLNQADHMEALHARLSFQQQQANLRRRMAGARSTAKAGAFSVAARQAARAMAMCEHSSPGR